LGQLKVGYAADLAFFRVSDIQHSGHHDPITTLILSGAHQAFHVMVAGKWCVIQGELANVDAEALKAKHQSAARALLSRL
jgi:8-oxoguanine deaminase